MTNRINIKAEITIAILNPVLFPNVEITKQKKKKKDQITQDWLCWQTEEMKKKDEAS